MVDRVGQQLGNYQLIRLLGEGGFAEVYLGEHMYLKTQVAIKVLHMHLVQEEFPGFLQEAQTIAHLKHPNIIPVFDFGIDGAPFLIMDYLPNGSLRDRHLRGTTVPLSTIISYVNQIAAALQYAHDMKVIHRDVKPANMLVGSSNQVILSDFGIATTAHRTSSMQKINSSGSPPYMAPEHIAGKPRPASDQYALGMVVYEWLCGKPPFTGEHLVVMYQQTYEPVPSLREQVPTIVPEVEQVVLRALAKEPAQRFSNVKGFASALEQAYQAEQALTFVRPPSIPIPPPPPPYQLSDNPTPQSQPYPGYSPQPHIDSIKSNGFYTPPAVSKTSKSSYLPLVRGKAGKRDVFAILGYGIALYLIGLPLYFSSCVYSNKGCTNNILGWYAFVYFGIILGSGTLLTGAIFGKWRGMFIILIYSLCYIVADRINFLINPGSISYHHYSQLPSLMSILTAVLIVGHLYERRQARGWLMLLGTMLLGSLVFGIGSTVYFNNWNTTPPSLLITLVIFSTVLVAIPAIILERVVQRIVKSRQNKQKIARSLRGL